MPPLKATFTPYSHTRLLAEGEVELDRNALRFVPVDPIIKAYREMVRDLAYDVAELAPTTYLLAREKGVPIVGIPVFTKRQFHHGHILCHPDAGIRTPADLMGKRVGVRAYSVTTGVWVRGLLSDDFGVGSDQVQWVTDDEEHVAGYVAPPNVTAAPPGESLVAMLRRGEIDAALTGNAGVGRSGAPEAGWAAEEVESARVLDKAPVPLFETPEVLENEWYQRTGIYPIHAMIVMREDLVRRDPALPTEVYQAFCAAKEKAGIDRRTLVAESTGASAIPTDQDAIPYGIEPNTRSIAALVRYATEQKLLTSPVTPESMFAPGDYQPA